MEDKCITLQIRLNRDELITLLALVLAAENSFELTKEQEYVVDYMVEYVPQAICYNPEELEKEIRKLTGE